MAGSPNGSNGSRSRSRSRRFAGSRRSGENAAPSTAPSTPPRPAPPAPSTALVDPGPAPAPSTALVDPGLAPASSVFSQPLGPASKAAMPIPSGLAPASSVFSRPLDLHLQCQCLHQCLKFRVWKFFLDPIHSSCLHLTRGTFRSMCSKRREPKPPTMCTPPNRMLPNSRGKTH